jgi:hypothetical protein
MSGLQAHVVKPGEYLASLAYRFGFDADAVWNAPKNADLKKLRDPNILAPGDILYIPMPPEGGVGLQVNAEASNDFAARVPTVVVELVILDENGDPCANEPVEVVGLPQPLEDPQTKGDGSLSLEVSVVTESVTVGLPNRNQILQVWIGHLNPLDDASEDLSGMAGRLANLGHLAAGDVKFTAADGSLATAVKTFQKANAGKLNETGTLDEPTRLALKKAHGS